jgi:hypothetical protein
VEEYIHKGLVLSLFFSFWRTRNTGLEALLRVMSSLVVRMVATAKMQSADCIRPAAARSGRRTEPRPGKGLQRCQDRGSAAVVAVPPRLRIRPVGSV